MLSDAFSRLAALRLDNQSHGGFHPPEVGGQAGTVAKVALKSRTMA
jgi:hypothetical protein